MQIMQLTNLLLDVNIIITGPNMCFNLLNILFAQLQLILANLYFWTRQPTTTNPAQPHSQLQNMT